jgi:Tol biopolymer transport system component
MSHHRVGRGAARRAALTLGLMGLAIAVAAPATTAATAKTRRVSVHSNGVQANHRSGEPFLSGNGRFIAFWSQAGNLVVGDTNNFTDAFVHDRTSRKTRRVSLRSNGVQGNGDSEDPVISANGRFVAFESTATNLVGGDTNGVQDIFVHDRRTKKTTRVSRRSNGVQGNGESRDPVISADGRYVAFESDATNLVGGDTNGVSDVFVHDRKTRKTTRVSRRSNGVQGDGPSEDASISADGRYVAFESDATNLVVGDTNFSQDIFVHDRKTRQTTRVSRRSNGVQADDGSNDPVISANGRFVAFESTATNLVVGDTNNRQDIFVHDRASGKTTRVSRRSNGVQANDDTEGASISANGRWVTFTAFGPLINTDTNGVEDVYLHDRKTRKTRRLSVRSNGVQGNGDSSQPAVSGDGRFVAFRSEATNLVSGDTNDERDIFLRGPLR